MSIFLGSLPRRSNQVPASPLFGDEVKSLVGLSSGGYRSRVKMGHVGARSRVRSGHVMGL